jgi:uncharacterized phiE125 gp8 family phage protein
MTHQYAIEIVTPPAAEPVSLNELKTHLRVNTAAEDALLTGYITAARETFEAMTGRACKPTTFRQHVHQFNGPVALMKAPVTSIVSVKVYDQDDQLQDVEGYETDLLSCPAWVWLPDGYPSLSSVKRPVAQVEFVAGWTTTPETVKLAIKLLAGHYFKNREAYTATSFVLRDLPMGFRAVCDQFMLGITGYGNW